MSLLVEALVVGIVSGIFGLAISTLIMMSSKNFSWRKYDFWPQVFLSFFLTGFILHFIFEISGANGWYCKNGVACRT